MPGPVDASCAGIGRVAPGGIDQMELALVAPRIALGKHGDDVGRGFAFSQHCEAVHAVQRIDEGLCGDGAHAAANMRDDGADREEPAGDRYTQMAGRRIAGND